MPFTTGNNWGADDGPTRAFGLTLHGFCESKNKEKPFEVSITDGFNKRDDINKVLLDFAMKFGTSKMWKELDRRMLTMGTMTIFAGKNCSKDSLYTFRMSGSSLENVENGNTYPDLSNQQQSWELKPDETKLFAVQIVKNPHKSHAPTYKYGLTTKKLQ